MTWEVFTLGGGSFLVAVFNAVSAVFGTSDYEIMRALVLSAGVVWVALRLAWPGGQMIDAVKYVAIFTMVYGVLVVPRGTVHITDRLNPLLAPATIDNVPMGLGFFAGVSSAAGDALTRLMEAVFTLPDDLKYQRHGLVFGSRLMEAATRFKITDPAFAESLDAYARQCVFPALALGHLDFKELAEATDVWAVITRNPSPARMFQLRGRDPRTGALLSRSIVTCAVGAPQLTATWNAETTRATGIFARRLFPDQSKAAARAHLLAALPSAHTHLIGASRNALDIMRQQMTINALYDSSARWASATDNPAALRAYADARAELQTRSAYTSMGVAAGKLVPTLKVVFEALFYGFFPVAVLLMMTPLGLGVFKSYFFAFVWLQSWGPLYAIINLIMMGQAKNRMSAAADMGSGPGVSMVAQAGIQAIEADVAVSAGYLSASLPFVALLLIKGGIHYAASMATSHLAVGQQAASEAAREATTGNVSLGNTTQDAHRFQTTEGFRTQQSPAFDAARDQTVNADGSEMVYHADGRVSTFQKTSGSDLATSIDFAEMRSDQLRESAGHSRNLGESQMASAGASLGTAATSGAGLLDQVSRGVSNSEGWTQSLSADERTSFNQLQQHAEKVSEMTGLDRVSSMEVMAKAHLGGSGSALGKVMSLVGGAEVGGSLAGRSISLDQAQAAEDYLQQAGVSEDIGRALSASQRLSAESSDSSLQSLGERYEANLTESRSFEERAGVNFSEAESYETQAAQVDSRSAAINQRLAGQFFDYVAEQPGLMGAPLGHGGAARLAHSRDMGDQTSVRHLANDFVRENYERDALAGSSQLENDYGQARNDLEHQAGVREAHGETLDNVRGGGADLGGGDAGSLSGDVETRLKDAEEKIKQEHDRADEAETAREAIRREANQSARSAAGDALLDNTKAGLENLRNGVSSLGRPSRGQRGE